MQLCHIFTGDAGRSGKPQHQRLVDHRARHVRDARELDVLTAPLEPLVDAVERLVRQLEEIGRELSELDEGAMVRGADATERRKCGREIRSLSIWIASENVRS